MVETVLLKIVIHIIMNSGNDIASSTRTKQLEHICSSGDLSFAKLCRVIEGKRLEDLHKSSFLHRVCLNKNVTFEIVKYLLDLYPALLHYEMKVDDIVITSYSTQGILGHPIRSQTPHPLNFTLNSSITFPFSP